MTDPGDVSTGVRRAAIGGVVGPAAFVGSWLTGAVAMGRRYSSIDDAISRLAAIGATSRPLMTAGFVVFGVAVPTYAFALRKVVPGPAWVSAAATGIATLAVAAAPLGRSTGGDRWHAVFAVAGYATLAATPLLAARPLTRGGHRLLARMGVAAASVSAVALSLTATGSHTGLFQRVGLTTTDAWVVATAIAIAAGRLRTVGPSSAVQHHRMPGQVLDR